MWNSVLVNYLEILALEHALKHPGFSFINSADFTIERTWLGLSFFFFFPKVTVLCLFEILGTPRRTPQARQVSVLKDTHEHHWYYTLHCHSHDSYMTPDLFKSINITLWERFYCLYFIDEETGAQNVELTCLKSQQKMEGGEIWN